MKRILAFVGVLASATLVASGVTYAAVHQSDNRDPLTIDVVGHAKITTTPSILETTIGVTATADTTGNASKLLADTLQKVMDSLKNNGVKPEDIKTGSISTGGYTPQYCNVCDSSQSMPTYVQSNTARASVTVRLHDLSNIGKAIGDVLALDNDAKDKIHISVNTASFVVENPDQYTQQAQASATSNGREQAAAMAKAAHMKLGKLLTITVETKPNILPVRAYSETNGAAAVEDSKVVSSIPVNPGQTDIEASVALTYRLK